MYNSSTARAGEPSLCEETNQLGQCHCRSSGVKGAGQRLGNLVQHIHWDQAHCLVDAVVLKPTWGLRHLHIAA